MRNSSDGYDANGNQTSRGGDTFSYDHENRLTEVRIGGGAPNPCYDFNGDGVVDGSDISEISNYFGGQEPFYDLNGDGFVDGTDINRVGGQFGQFCPSRFSYNGDGLRVGRAGSHLNWKYVWDVAAGLPVILKETDSHNELDGHGTNNTYVYGLDLISVTDRTGAQSYFLYDGLGSVTGITDGNGNLGSSFAYDVFGDIRSGSGGGTESEFRFTGEQRDPQLQRNFYYLRARYYDPAIGRLVSRDPVEGLATSPQTQNRYAYAGSDPVNRIDPTGLCHRQLGGDALCLLVHRVNTGEDKEGAGFTITCSGQDFECLPRLARPLPTPPCEAIPGSTCCYTPQEPAGFICGTGSYAWLGAILDALTSECAQGIAAGLAAGLLISGSVVSGAVIIQSGGLVTTSVGAAATSAAGIGAYALGPVPSETLTNIGTYTYNSILGIGECY